jgi:hypothetical protein
MRTFGETEGAPNEVARSRSSVRYGYDQQDVVLRRRDVSVLNRKAAELSRQLGCPAAVAQGVNLHPNPALPLI